VTEPFVTTGLYKSNPHAFPLLIIGLLMFVSGIFVFQKRPFASVNRAFFLICLSVTCWLIATGLGYLSIEPSLAKFWFKLDNFGVMFISVTVFHFVCSFLQVNRKTAIKLGYLVASLFGLTAIFTDMFVIDVRKYYWGYFPRWNLWSIIFLLFFFTYMATSLNLLWKEYQEVQQPVRKNQIKYLFFAFLLAYTGSVDYLPAFGFPIYPFGFISIFLFLLVVATTIIKYRLMDINLAITRTAVFAVVYALALGVPLLVASWWQPKLEVLLGQHWWIGLWLIGASLATAAHYANLYFQRRAENRLLAEQKRYQAALRQASQGMTLIKDLDRLLKLIVHLLTQKVRIKHAAVYLWDERMKRFILQVSRQWKKEGAVPSFTKEDPLLEYLHWHRAPLVTEELQLQARADQAQLQPVVDSLKTLDAAVLIPSFVEDHCLGLLVLGEKLSEALYTSDDLSVFQVLANQAALAIENAQFYEELKRTQADLFQTAKMASLGHMAGGMSHQINNRFHVLTILAGTLKAAMRNLDPTSLDGEKLKEFWNKTLETLMKIEENALRGGDIVKTLLRFSRPTQEYQPVPLSKIISTALEIVQYRVNLSSLDLIQEIPEDLPQVKGNLNQLSDSLFNLISNASDAIQKKAELIQSGELFPTSEDPSPYRGRIRLKARVDGSEDKPWVIFEIQDNGTGITPEELDNLFIPFFTTKATAEKGTGLGLYIIQRIMEHHGGTIKATSTYGKGITFTMQLPAAPPETQQETQEATHT